MGLYFVLEFVEGVEEGEKSRHACGTAENTYLVIPLALAGLVILHNCQDLTRNPP